MTGKHISSEQIDALIQGNPGAWFESHAQIKGRSGKMERPRMNILQRRINAAFMASRRRGVACRIIGLKPRKRGFSTMVSAIHYTELQKHSYEGVIVGNKLETSATVFRMMANYAKSDDMAKAHSWGSAAKWTTESAKWEHGSLLSQSTAKNAESIRGQTPQVVHGTEVAFWENEEEVFLALMNAIPDDPCTCVFLESTPKGNTGAFATRWKEARWPDPDECPDGAEYWRYWESDCPNNGAECEMVRVFAAWFEFEESTIRLTEHQKQAIRETLDGKSWYEGERALITKFGNTRENGVERLGMEVEEFDVWEQLAWRRKIIREKCGFDPRKFDQEYPADPTSCFLASGNPVFDADAVARLSADARKVPMQTGAIDLVGVNEDRAAWRDCEPDLANFWMWEKPRVGCRYLISVDTAEGEDQTGGDDPDHHSVLVWRHAYRDKSEIDHDHRLVARVSPPCTVPIHALVEMVWRLYLYYGRPCLIPEMNNSGLAFIVGAKAKGMTIWMRQVMNKRSGKVEEKEGFRTTDTADYGGIRTLVIDNLAKLLRGETVDIACPNFTRQAGAFVTKDGKAQAGVGEHDDDIMSGAIGLYNIGGATVYGEAIVPRQIPAYLQKHFTGDESEIGLAMRT